MFTFHLCFSRQRLILLVGIIKLSIKEIRRIKTRKLLKKESEEEEEYNLEKYEEIEKKNEKE